MIERTTYMRDWKRNARLDPAYRQRERTSERERRRVRRQADPAWRERVNAQKRMWWRARAAADRGWAEQEQARRRAHERAKADANHGLGSQRSRFTKYGITAQRYFELGESQNWACAVCGVVPARGSDGRDGLHVDHRHDNGVIRGLLCSRCNRHVATLDLDVDYLAALRAFALRGAP